MKVKSAVRKVRLYTMMTVMKWSAISLPSAFKVMKLFWMGVMKNNDVFSNVERVRSYELKRDIGFLRLSNRLLVMDRIPSVQ